MIASATEAGYVDGLLTHFAPMRRRFGKSLDLWCSTRAEAGMDTAAELRARLDGATMALVFVSPTLLAEHYDLLGRLEALARKGLLVIPVVARSTALTFGTKDVRPGDPWIVRLEALPKGGTPLSSARNLDEVMANMAIGVADIIERINAETVASPKHEPPRSPDVTMVVEVLDALVSSPDRRADLYREMFSLCGAYPTGGASADVAAQILTRCKSGHAIANICAWKMMRLMPTQFENVVFRTGIPVHELSGRAAPQGTRALEVVQYMEGQGRINDLVTLLGAG